MDVQEAHAVALTSFQGHAIQLALPVENIVQLLQDFAPVEALTVEVAHFVEDAIQAPGAQGRFAFMVQRTGEETRLLGHRMNGGCRPLGGQGLSRLGKQHVGFAEALGQLQIELGGDRIRHLKRIIAECFAAHPGRRYACLMRYRASSLNPTSGPRR